jgi:TonB family protein
VVHTEVFNASGSSAKPTVNAPIKEVQTGGFGDPNGFPGEAQGGSHGNVAKLGSFDLPPGPGYGNGSGGSYGARGVMATGGFGNGIASTAGERGGTGGGGRGGVRSSGFGDARAIPEAPKPQAQTVTPKVQPMEITFKPKPIYSEEARRLGLEGEVVLEAVFSASGELRVLRVVRGLGHGLDEAALRAAEQIRFKPAQRDGQPVDTTATLHILFELAG